MMPSSDPSQGETSFIQCMNQVVRLVLCLHRTKTLLLQGDEQVTDTTSEATDEIVAPQPPEEPRRGNPAKPFAIVILIVTILIAGWYAASDRLCCTNKLMGFTV